MSDICPQWCQRAPLQVSVWSRPPLLPLLMPFIHLGFYVLKYPDFDPAQGYSFAVTVPRYTLPQRQHDCHLHSIQELAPIKRGTCDYPIYCSSGISSYQTIFLLKSFAELSLSKNIRTSLVAQMIKRLPTMQETWVQSLGWEDPLEKEMAVGSSTLAWKSP